MKTIVLFTVKAVLFFVGLCAVMVVLGEPNEEMTLGYIFIAKITAGVVAFICGAILYKSETISSRK